MCRYVKKLCEQGRRKCAKKNFRIKWNSSAARQNFSHHFNIAIVQPLKNTSKKAFYIGAPFFFLFIHFCSFYPVFIYAIDLFLCMFAAILQKSSIKLQYKPYIHTPTTLSLRSHCLLLPLFVATLLFYVLSCTILRIDRYIYILQRCHTQ